MHFSKAFVPALVVVVIAVVAMPASCAGCAPGTYADITGCLPCPAGFACANAADAPVPCSAGRYSTPGSTSCSECDAGYLCPPESTSPTPVGASCPLGSYCPRGAATPLLCPGGTYGGSTGLSLLGGCTTCDAGKYCPTGTAGTGAQLACPSGHYCPGGSPHATPCPAGTYNTAADQSSRASCAACPEGYFCPSGASEYAPHPCPLGFYCPAGTGSGFENACPPGTYGNEARMTCAAQCTMCPAGYSCPQSGLTAPLPCQSGMYQPETGSGSCLDCVAGFACPRSGMVSYLGTSCAAGHFCPTGTGIATSFKCPGGTYSFRTNLQSERECEVCWRGFHCPPGTGYSGGPQPCSAGYFCPGAPPNPTGLFYYRGVFEGESTTSATQFPCPPGTFATATTLYNVSQCTPCTPGSYCSGGSAAVTGPCAAGYYCPESSPVPKSVPCPAGTYNPVTGHDEESDCLPCQPGHYCVAGSASMADCPPGSYNPVSNAIDIGPSGDEFAKKCIVCPAGHFCVQQSIAPVRCDEGEYSSSGAGTCTSCESGHYCPKKGTTVDQKQRLFLCPAGLLCPAALDTHPTATTHACPAGHYCPLGTKVAEPCPPGTYNPAVGRATLADCRLCSKGFFCSTPGATGVTGECDPGHYCPIGSSSATQEPCPPRYYRSATRGESDDFCSVCPRGSYCPQGTSSHVPCKRGYYCITGSEAPQPCPIGTFGNATNLRSQDECSPCTAGYYCDGLGLSHPTGLCDPGYYCISRAFTSAPPGLPTGGLCPKGGYCPPGSSFPTACAEGTFNNFTGGSTQQDCVACTPGFYCSGSNLPFPTGPCAAGYYCTGGASLPTQFRTPAGHYSLAGAPAPTECPLGTFNPSPAQGACTPCLSGYYCSTRAMVNYLPCPSGSYCPTASVLPKACVLGTYQPEMRKSNISNCLACPPGKYCGSTNASSFTANCDAGFYCKHSCISPTCSQYSSNYALANNQYPVGVENSVGGPCPWGQYCPENTSIPIDCPLGTFRDAAQGTVRKDACSSCPPGFFCDLTGMSRQIAGKEPKPCGAGYFCPGHINGADPDEIRGCEDQSCATYRGQPCELNTLGCWTGANTDLTTTGPRGCPTGFYCPQGVAMPTKCRNLLDGKSTYAGARRMTFCELCPKGHYCDENNVKSLQEPIICPPGKYCPEGTTLTQPECPKGSYSEAEGLTNRTSCTLCPPGRYCPWPGRSTRYVLDMPFCLGGYYCTLGAYTGEGINGQLGGEGGPCPPGYFCPNATVSNVSHPCPPGTYKPTELGVSLSACLPCDPGRYCTGPGQSTITGDCAPGYYCPTNCADDLCSNRACDAGIWAGTNLSGGACPKGYRCPLRSAAPIPCTQGNFQSQFGQPTCEVCPAGYHCGDAQIDPVECGTGRYCPVGTRTDSVPECPPGTFMPNTTAEALADCALCEGGKFCGTPALPAPTGECWAGRYCESGADTAAGTVGAQGGSAGDCPAGHFCPIGTAGRYTNPCPEGHYNPSSLRSTLAHCLPCDGGKFCTGQGQVNYTDVCREGYYCPSACQDAQCTNMPRNSSCTALTGGKCPVGHYCPTGSVMPTPCDRGTFAFIEGLTVCAHCPAGQVCPDGTINPQTCPTGHYCPAGTTGFHEFPCPDGTYQPGVNKSTLNDCLRCSAGSYCAGTGKEVVTAQCSPGYFCQEGAATPDANLGPRGGTAGICPVGHYCLIGTVAATQHPCPPGSFNNETGQVSEAAACRMCPPGRHCAAAGQSAVPDLCREGYFCTGGCIDDICTGPVYCGAGCTPGATAQGGICPVGHVCPGDAPVNGQVAPDACPAGVYAPNTGMTMCAACPTGKYCPPTTSVPTSCPDGSYCPENTTSVIPKCPHGSYNIHTDSHNITSCARCAAGFYCDNEELSTPTAKCAPGYYCVSGALDAQGAVGSLGGVGGICPVGHYCLEGTRQENEFPCPVGTMQPLVGQTNSSACIPCPAGFFCNSTGQHAVSGPCAAGFHCTGACEDELCANKCNTSCTVGAGGPCPRGYYCPQVAVAATPSMLGDITTIGNIVPLSCPPGSYTASTGQHMCAECPASSYCIAGSINPDPIVCPKGKYCPAGTNATQPLCPEGSYNPSLSIAARANCVKCDAGHACQTEGMVTTGVECAGGYYCPGGAKNVYGVHGDLGGVENTFPLDGGDRFACPPGHYCPNGTDVPLRCPHGTYNPHFYGFDRNTSCLMCDGGMHCNATGLAAPIFECDAGYFCPAGCADAQCSVTVFPEMPGGPCPKGHHCPTKSPAPIPCTAGNYAQVTGKATCDVCPARFHCGNTQIDPTDCPAGSFCPQGTEPATIQPCAVGTFSNTVRLQEQAECTLCPAGRACTALGLTAPDDTCSAGYYCGLGALDVYGNLTTHMNAVGGICPVGHYCVANRGAPEPCVAGTFNPVTGGTNVAACHPCTAGMFCATAQLSVPTGPCAPGYFCPTGQSDARPAVGFCPPGSYCIGGRATHEQCPPGTHQPIQNATSAADCQPCPAGMYCELGSGVATGPCDSGFYCPGGQNTSRPPDYICQAGNYCPQQSSAQIPCTPGSFCETPQLSEPTAQCNNGYFCTSSSTTPTPSAGPTGGPCPAGHYCPLNSSAPTECPEGTLNPNMRSHEPSACARCPPRFYCPGTGRSSTTLLCEQGYYCPGGNAAARGTPCPIGHHCPTGSSAPTRCISGQYQDETAKAMCKTCPEGSYCDQNSVCPTATVTMPVTCPKGHYCPAGTSFATEFPCPAGKYAAGTGLEKELDCTICDPGRYCPNPGTFEVTGTPCRAGHFCIRGASVPNPTDGTTGNICPAGSYCAEGVAAPSDCPIGRYGPSEGLRAEHECTQCPAGEYCPTPRATATAGNCDPGHYCPAGSTSKTQIECTFGHACPSGSGEPATCPTGSYVTNTGNAQCLACPAGSFCDVAKPCLYSPSGPGADVNYTCARTCPLGHYCPINTTTATQYPCPPGRFGDVPNLEASTDCKKCLAGEYCPSPGMTAASSMACAKGYWCIGGSAEERPTDNVTGQICPEGHYCPAGTTAPRECPAGTYNPEVGGTNVSACAMCTPGKACMNNKLAAPDVDCQARFYCPGGQLVPNPAAYLCPLGFHCPAGSPAHIPCAAGTYTDQAGEESCKLCPGRHYCASSKNITTVRECPMGHYCPNGTTFATEFPCPVGTFSDKTGLLNVSECLPCAAGRACTTPGLSTELPNCTATYHCISGANTTTPTDGVTGRLCPAGSYCPEGAPSPIPCPPGTMSNGTGLEAVEQCQQCTAGSFCESSGLTEPTGPCSQGYYCPGGDSARAPAATPCTGGRYCPPGTAIPRICPNGKFVPEAQLGAATCSECPETQFCNIDEQQLPTYGATNQHIVPQNCPVGHYCPRNTASRFEHKCPTKTFSNTENLAHSSQCDWCTAGMYCERPGQTEPTGQCEPGYMCLQGSNMSQPALPDVLSHQGRLCDTGYYCPIGSSIGKPCPSGTYNGGRGATNVTACTPCRGGWFCADLGGSTPTAECDAGFYCPGGDNVPAPFKCPTGHYCGVGTVSPVPCPAGFYNPTETQSTCLPCDEAHYCPVGSVDPKPCPLGSVCPLGTGYPLCCPNGTYADKLAIVKTSFSQCTVCPSGEYCTNGTITSPCAAGFLCVAGNSRPDPQWENDGELDSRNGMKRGGLCPIGHFCPEGTKVKMPCTNQTVGYKEGLQRASDCEPCRPGYYCVEASVVPIDCPKGYYCPGYVGQGVGLLPCPTGTFNDLNLATDSSWCLPCKQGYYCPNEAMVATTQFASPPGFWSGSGQTVPYSCPAGTFNPTSNGTATAEACLECPVGHYCPPSSTHNVTCPEGTICPPGSPRPQHCPGSHYCPPDVIEPIPCPAGFHCPPLTNYPIACWNGTYCPAKTEIPLLCPNGMVSRNDTASRVTLQESCQVCPAGTYGRNALYCEPCNSGHVCLTGATTGNPLSIPVEKGYICPIGNYCPGGSSEPTPCPAGTYNQQPGGRSSAACTPCTNGTYQPLSGQSTCRRCGNSATAPAGSPKCTCLGQNRAFQDDDGSCRCKPGFIFYTNGQRLSEDDASFDCQEIIYPRCNVNQYRASTGECVTPRNEQVCDMCPNRLGRIDPQLGVCSCDQIQAEEEVCDQRCRLESNQMFIDEGTFELVMRDPTTGAESRVDLASASLLGKKNCSNGGSSCTVRMVTMGAHGVSGVYNPTPELFAAATNATNGISAATVATVRRLEQSTTAAKTLQNPVVCLNNGESMLWEISTTRVHFPVYLKDSLLNTNHDFDYSAFRTLSERIRDPTLAIGAFIFPFNEVGVYVFADNSNSELQQTIIRVVGKNEKCPDTPFMAVTEGSLVAMGVQKDRDPILEPDWVLVGVLLSGLVLLILGTVFGLWQFRRLTWGIVGTALPRYRNLGMELLGGKASQYASKGNRQIQRIVLGSSEERLPTPAGSSKIITLRLDTPMAQFEANEFIDIIAAEAGVTQHQIMILSITEGSTIVRFVVTNCDNANDAAQLLMNRIVDESSDIHSKLPILAVDAAEDAQMAKSSHPVYAMNQLEDEYWDYERQIDLEGFNVRTLYDKLEDQTIHIVSQLANQRDDVLLLCDKILVESEALKDMFFKVKMDMDEKHKLEKDAFERRQAKLEEGQVEFDLPEDLKSTLTNWLNDFFRTNFGDLMAHMKPVGPPGGEEHQGVFGGDGTRRTEEEIVKITENITVQHIDDGSGNFRVGRSGGAVSMRREKNGVPVEEQFDEVDPEMTNIRGFNDMFKRPETNDGFGGRQGARKERPHMGLGEVPTEMKDDSDLDDEDRLARAQAREKHLRMKLNRARRVMDRVVMPPGLELLPAEVETRPEAELKQAKKDRIEYQAKCRDVRKVTDDDVPLEYVDDTRLPLTERLARSDRRQKHIFRKMHALRGALGKVGVPDGMQDDEALPAKERRERTAKRTRYVQQKINKARRARFETMTSADAATNSDMSDTDIKARRDKADEQVGDLMAVNPYVPTLPTPEAHGIDQRTQERRRVALDTALRSRVTDAMELVSQMDVPEGLSDRSDMDEDEADRRRRERAALHNRRCTSFCDDKAVARTGTIQGGDTASQSGEGDLGTASAGTTSAGTGGTGAGVGAGTSTTSSGVSVAGEAPALLQGAESVSGTGECPAPAMTMSHEGITVEGIHSAVGDEFAADGARARSIFAQSTAFPGSTPYTQHTGGLLENRDTVPEEYEDDSDLDEEERRNRSELREHFRRGRKARIDAPPVLNEFECGLSGPEETRRKKLNAAFQQGQATSIGADPERLKAMAEQITKDGEEAKKDPVLAKQFTKGQQQQQQGQLPEEFKGDAQSKIRLRRAFEAGCRSVTVSQPPPDLVTEKDLAEFESAKQAACEVVLPTVLAGKRAQEMMFRLGRDTEKAKAFVEFMEVERDSGDRDKAEAMTSAFGRGREAANALLAPSKYKADRNLRNAFYAGIIGGEPTAAMLTDSAQLKAFQEGVEQRNLVDSSIADLSDNIELLGEDEIKRRRILRAAFQQGANGAVADGRLKELAADKTLSEQERAELKAAFEAGHRAQKAANTVPLEVVGNTVAFIRGRGAVHLAEAVLEEPAELASENDRTQVAIAVQRGRKAQVVLDEMPDDIKDMPHLAPEERERRVKLRKAFQAGKLSQCASNWESTVQKQQAMVAVSESAAAAAGTTEPAGSRDHSPAGRGATTDASPDAGAAGKRGSAARETSTADTEHQMKQLKREYARAGKQLREKHRIDTQAAMEELEEECMQEAKNVEEQMREQFEVEKKKLQDKHNFAMIAAPAERHAEMRRAHESGMSDLVEAQQVVAVQAQQRVIQRSQERKGKLKTLLDQKNLNELRLQKTLQVNQQHEVERLAKIAPPEEEMESMAPEARLDRQKEQLMEKLKSREKRLKAKAAKEREFLEAELAGMANLEREAVEMQIRDKQEVMMSRVADLKRRGVLDSKEAVEEEERIVEEATQQKKRAKLKIEATLKAERMAEEKGLSERHTSERNKELEIAQVEVDKLLEKQRAIENNGPAGGTKLTPEAQAAIELLVQQQAQRQALKEDLDEQRAQEATKVAQRDPRVSEDAEREVARREREIGHALSEKQKADIIEECARNAASMEAATTAEQKRQQEDAKKRLEQRRQKKEAELHRRQLDEMRKELKRQEDEQRTRDDRAKKQGVSAPGAAAVTESAAVKREEEVIEQRVQQALADMQRRHEQERQQSEAQLEQERKKLVKREEQRLKDSRQKRVLELQSQQAAQESGQMKENEKQALMQQHAQESKALEDQLAAEAHQQRSKLQAQLEVRRAKKKMELDRKQRDETAVTREKEVEKKDEMLREVKLEAEKKAIDAAASKPGQAAAKKDLAHVIMSNRHREEVVKMRARQTERCERERVKIDTKRQERLDQISTEMEQQVERQCQAAPEKAQQIRAEGRAEHQRKLAASAESLDADKQNFLCQLELEFAEEQLQLRLRHHNEISEAAGLTALNANAVDEYRAKVAQRSVGDAEKELLAFKNAKQAEQEAVASKLEKEKTEYEQQMQEEMARRRAAQEQELKEREVNMLKKLDDEKHQREKKLAEMRLQQAGAGGGEQKDIADRLLKESKEDDARLKQQIQREHERQRQDLAEMLRKKRERNERKRDAMEKLRQESDAGDAFAASQRSGDGAAAAGAPPTAIPTDSMHTSTHTHSHTHTIENVLQQSVIGAAQQQQQQQQQVARSGAVAPPQMAHDQWVTAMIGQLSHSPLMEKVIKIERMLEQQVKHGLLSYYMDSKDVAQKCEGRLVPVDPVNLSAAEYTVSFFGNALVSHISELGVAVPNVSIQIASQLPQPVTVTNAFRHSYHYDSGARILYVRQSRLETLGEYAIVLIHALAHVKAEVPGTGASSWNDADPAFLKEFYGLLECCTEEMFFTRLPTTFERAPRSQYRPVAIMNKESLGEIEKVLKGVPAAGREEALKKFLHF